MALVQSGKYLCLAASTACMYVGVGVGRSSKAQHSQHVQRTTSLLIPTSILISIPFHPPIHPSI